MRLGLLARRRYQARSPLTAAGTWEAGQEGHVFNRDTTVDETSRISAAETGQSQCTHYGRFTFQPISVVPKPALNRRVME